MPKGIYNRVLKDPFERFIKKVSKLESGCWIWHGSKNEKGYGYFGVSTGKCVLAHQWSYAHFKGPVPSGTEIDHLCRNRDCVNPDHLEAVTHQENMRRGVPGQHMIEKSKNLTHCPNGHPYNATNTYLHKGKYKQCRVCKNEHQRGKRKTAICND